MLIDNYNLLQSYIKQETNPKLKRIEQIILDQIDSNLPISHHHHLKFLWHQDRVDTFLRGRPYDIKPITVEFVPSLDCNFGCGHCTYDQWKNRTIDKIGHRKMLKENMQFLLDKLAYSGVKSMIITGGGEPFTNPHTIEGIEYAKSLGFDLGVFTNGSLLNPEKIDKISSHANFVRISLDAVTEDVYLAFHGINNPRIFETVKANIKYFASISQRKSKTASFGLGVIVKEFNVDDMTNVAVFARDVVNETGGGIKAINYRPVINYREREKQISPVVLEKAKRHEEKIRRVLEDTHITPFFAFDYFADAVAGQERKKEYQKCLANPWAASVAYDGNLYLCSENDGNQKFALGNLLNQSLDEIWESSRRKEIIGCIGDCEAPTCKLHRLNKSLNRIGEVSLTEEEIVKVNEFCDILKNAGNPGGPNFL